MKKLLVVSPFCAYKTVRHAGGKVHYHYLKKIEERYAITHIGAAKSAEREAIEAGGIKAKKIIFYQDAAVSRPHRFFLRLQSCFSQRNPFDRYAGFIEYPMHRFFVRECRKLARQGYSPDIVLLDWTQAVFLAQRIKRLFPSAFLICIEQDVSYLKYRRFFEENVSSLKKIVRRHKYRNIMRQELASLRHADEIVAMNVKDRDLLLRDAGGRLPGIRVVVPYFDSYFDVCRSTAPSSDILFFGAMSRPENFKSAIWFIEHVLPLLPERFRFLVAGNNPASDLLRYNGGRVLVLGFVKDVRPLFADSLCMVSPLVSGAGIKIKILEALSAAIPVITNTIGIEGIPAERGRDYVFAESPEEYAAAIQQLAGDGAYRTSIGQNGRAFVLNRFSYERESYIKESDCPPSS